MQEKVNQPARGVLVVVVQWRGRVASIIVWLVVVEVSGRKNVKASFGVLRVVVSGIAGWVEFKLVVRCQ